MFDTQQLKRRVAYLLAVSLVCMIPVSALAQVLKVSLKRNNVPMETILQEIEKLSDYTLFYSDNQVKLTKKISINVKDAPIHTVLDEVFKNSGYTYHIVDNQIVVSAVSNTSMAVRSAQQQKKQQVSGVITDVTGEPIIGASIIEKGASSNGTITDLEGKFTLVVSGNELQVSYIGFIPQIIAIKGGTTSYNIVMKEDAKTLDEVVVVGYGTQKKANLSGSVASVDSKELQNRPIQNLTNGLQGLVPGVTITGTNGAPGMDNGTIRVRGTGTLNTATPYILIDGIEAGTLNSVDPNDIESISVLKDAASAAIYGSKASNGVILITTKRGKTGKAQVSYSGYVSFQNVTDMVERLSSAEYATMYNDALKAQGKAPRFDDTEIQKFRDGTDPLYPNTDWYDLAYKTGLLHRHNVNINGGTESTKYMASLGYLNQTGVLPNAEREQFNARMNLESKITDRLTARMNLAFIKNKYAEPSAAYGGSGADQVIRQLNLAAPWIVARHDDGTWGTISDGSPIAWLDSKMNVTRDNYNFTGMAALDYQVMDGLKLTLSGSYVNNLQNYQNFQKFIQYNPNKKSDPTLWTNVIIAGIVPTMMRY